MINIIFHILSVALLPTLVGYFLIDIILRKYRFPILLHLSLSIGIGFGILSFSMFLLGWLNFAISYSNVVILLILIILLSVGVLVFREKRGESISILNSEEKNIAITFLSIYAWIFVVYALYFVTWNSLNIPVIIYDAYARVAFKAKVLFFSQSLSAIKPIVHVSYPLHTPLLLDWVALSLGAWNDTAIKIIYPIYLISFVISFYYIIRILANRLWAILGILFLMMSQCLLDYASYVLTDIILMYYNVISISLLMLYVQQKDKGILILAALFCGMATFVKLEALHYMVALNIVVFLFIFKGGESILNALKRWLVFLIPSFGMWAIYATYKISSNIELTERTELIFPHDIVQRVLLVSQRYIEMLFMSWDWQLVSVLLCAALLANYKTKINASFKFLLYIIVVYVMIYLGAFTLTRNYAFIASDNWHDVLSRLFLHIYPIVLLAAVCLGYNRLENNQKEDLS